MRARLIVVIIVDAVVMRDSLEHFAKRVAVVVHFLMDTFDVTGDLFNARAASLAFFRIVFIFVL